MTIISNFREKLNFSKLVQSTQTTSQSRTDLSQIIYCSVVFLNGISLFEIGEFLNLFLGIKIYAPMTHLLCYTLAPLCITRVISFVLHWLPLQCAGSPVLRWLSFAVHWLPLYCTGSPLYNIGTWYLFKFIGTSFVLHWHPLQYTVAHLLVLPRPISSVLSPSWILF